MSQGGPNTFGGSGAPSVETLTGNSGGPVGPNGLFNIDILGHNSSGINVVGTPASNLLTIIGLPSSTSQIGTVSLATDAESIAGTDTDKAIVSSSLGAKLGNQTQYTLAIGNTTAGAFNWTNAGTDGQICIAATGADPVFASLTSTGGTITISEGANTLNIDTVGAVPIQFDTDSGSAVPALGILTVAGGTNMNTAGAASTVTINLDLDVLGLTDLTVDNLELNGNTISTTDTNGNLFITPDGTGGVVFPGDITVGYPSHVTSYDINGTTIMSQVIVVTEGISDLGCFTASRSGDTAAFGAHSIFLKSRNTQAAPTIVQDNDSIMRIIAAGFDGTDYAQCAEIQVQIDGTPGSDDMPGRILFLTSPDGTQVPVEAMRIDSSQVITLANALTVSNGGTGNTTLTDHSVLIGAGTNAITQVGPVSSTGAVLMSNGVGSDPGFSTATYPLTTTINEILYSSATNTVTGLATANRAVLTSGATGVPVMTALATDGQLIIGSTAGAPSAATLTAGTNVSISNGSNSITINANSGGQFVNVTLLDNTDSIYTVLSTDYYLSCNVSAGILVIDLPDAGNAGRIVIVKDSGGDAATNNITVTTVTGTDTIDGATSFVMNTNYEAANFIDNGTSWEVF